MRICGVEGIATELVAVEPNQAIGRSDPDKTGGILGKCRDHAIVDAAAITDGFEIGIIGCTQFQGGYRWHARKHECQGAQKVPND